MRSGRTPSLIHHTPKRDRPPAPPLLPKGGPLSLRSTRGSPCSRNACTRQCCTCGPVGAARATQRNRNRLASSTSVSGSQRRASRVRNQPLKSIVQTSLGARPIVTGGGGARSTRGRPAGVVTAQHLVARLAADAVRAAQGPHAAVPAPVVRDEGQPFIHGAGLLPWHGQHLLPKGHSTCYPCPRSVL